jgi:F-type H+-transporting ATPase subunit gamma
MASLKIIKKRITSVKSTQKITRAMKLVSAAKLRRASEKAHSSRPFEEELQSMVSTILNEIEWASPLTEVRPVSRVGVVICSTDRGLAGSLNANNFKAALRRVNEIQATGAKVEIIALGKKASEFFKKRGFEIHSVTTDLARNTSYPLISSIATDLRTKFLDKTFDRIEVFYSRFQSALVQKPTNFVLLPFVAPQSEIKKTFLYEPAAPELLNQLVPMLIDFQLYRVVLESIASEHGARMAAMESATKNAKEMIERLTLQRNRARQAAITKELMEIIGGAEAISA